MTLLTLHRFASEYLPFSFEFATMTTLSGFHRFELFMWELEEFDWLSKIKILNLDSVLFLDFDKINF